MDYIRIFNGQDTDSEKRGIKGESKGSKTIKIKMNLKGIKMRALSTVKLRVFIFLFLIKTVKLLPLSLFKF